MSAIWLVFLCFVGAILCATPARPLKCEKDEVKQCRYPCPPERTCRNRVNKYSCVIPEGPCEDKCVCKPGLYRNAIGECITLERCDQCNKPNEYYSCGGACDNVCATLQTQNQTNCPIQTFKCNERCYCDPGYARDEDGNCIPISECPLPLKCRKDEVKQCRYPCPPERTCRNRLIQFRCAAPDGPCKNECVCKPGLYRNAIGECITKERCEQCDKPNEYYTCGGACDNVCATLQTQNQTNCPIKNIKCNEWCYCDAGYARDQDGNCIPISECPQQCTEPNEEFAPCKPTCPPETCQSLKALYKCATDVPCEPRCVCKPGYLRSKEGAPCIPSEQCPNEDDDC